MRGGGGVRRILNFTIFWGFRGKVAIFAGVGGGGVGVRGGWYWQFAGSFFLVFLFFFFFLVTFKTEKFWGLSKYSVFLGVL